MAAKHSGAAQGPLGGHVHVQIYKTALPCLAGDDVIKAHDVRVISPCLFVSHGHVMQDGMDLRQHLGLHRFVHQAL